MKKLVLDYSTWRCGGEGPNKLGEGNTQLLNNEGYMCCLGQFALQLGANKKDILGWEDYEEAEILVEGLSSSSKDEDGDEEIRSSYLSYEAISINDDEHTSPNRKIEELKELFAKSEYEIEVINQPL